MQIDPNSGPAPIARVDTAAKSVKQAATESDSTAFSRVDELDKSLRELDDARPEVVKNAAALVNQSQWPPGDTIRRIADLLATTMGQNH